MEGVVITVWGVHMLHPSTRMDLRKNLCEFYPAMRLVLHTLVGLSPPTILFKEIESWKKRIWTEEFRVAFIASRVARQRLLLLKWQVWWETELDDY